MPHDWQAHKAELAGCCLEASNASHHKWRTHVQNCLAAIAGGSHRKPVDKPQQSLMLSAPHPPLLYAKC